MGQAVSSECTCQDGLFTMCGPQDPNQETETTLRAQPNPSAYPSSSQAAPSYAGGSDGPTFAAETASMRQDGVTYAQDEGGFIAPPPGEDFGGGVPPPAPMPSQGAGRYPPVPAQSTAAAQQDVTADDILSNLEGSEDVMYGNVFATFPGGLNGKVGLDCMAMRDFICTNSSVSMDDIDMELIKVAGQDDMMLSRDGFLHLLRDFSVSDSDVISHFMGLSADSESLSSEECRSGLLLFAQQKLHASYSDDRWECIFNIVMWDAGVTVSMEQFMNYSKQTGRIARLLRFAQVS